MSEQLARDLEILAELFKAGGWRELRVESEGVRLLFSTDPQTGGLGAATPTSVRPELIEGRAPTAGSLEESRASTSAARTDEGMGLNPAWHAVIAPNLGTFYRSPKPGAAPFVEVGQRVEPETEICLLEVMKLFTSVKAGVAGTVAKIAAVDAELVEGGQALFYIETD